MFRVFVWCVMALLSSLFFGGCCDYECQIEREMEANAVKDPVLATPDTGMVGGGIDLLTIDMPFATNTTSLCTQGANGSYSHHSRSTKYDVDFDTPNDSKEPVFAPVGGIAYAHDESRTKNYGYHVTIDEGDGTYVIIAHMDEIFVHDGDEVATGQLLGYEGHTGMADGDHVHIGRHSGDASKMGEYGTSIDALSFYAKDVTLGTTVTKRTTELTCDMSTGHTYESLLPTPKWHPSGSLLQEPSTSTVYLLDGFTLHPFLTESAFTGRNYNWNDVAHISKDEMACYSVGAAVEGASLVTAVYDGTSGWLVVGEATDATRYRLQLTGTGLSAVLATWGIAATELSALPSPSAAGVTLSNYPIPSTELATFRDGSLVSTYEQSDVYVMEGGVGLPIMDWDTDLLMGFGARTVVELAKHDFDLLVPNIGNCTTDSYCIARNDVTTCGGDTEDVPGTFPGESTGDDEVDDTGSDWDTSEATGKGLELWWWLASPADWITISGEFTNESGYSYGWNSNIAWSTESDELYFAIADMGSGDSFRYSYAFSTDGVESWSCLGPFPPGELNGTALATYNGAEADVFMVADPGSDGCGLEVSIP